ncbi:GDP-L-fucose synthase [uncultured Desulfosarcina sp.]|uniref:GDP-L-fucose synthase family protein n=1 Tax=uncultured Desulfosarcina sp. TaxID=218289 RepID=UPI0029C66500|nr:GDP-L-fucose synthase [uncultured Desulfosarcina sp.]
MNKNSKILVVGASGMVGSAIIRKLLSLGYNNIIGTYNAHMPDSTIFTQDDSPADMPKELKLERVDLTVQAAVNSFFSDKKPEYVFLAAARVGGIHANNTYPAQFIHNNLAIQSNTIHAAYQNGVDRLLFLGSSCIYPKLAPQPMKEEHLLTGLLEPTNEPYAIAKIAGIKMCEAYNRQYGTRFMAVMPTNLYGPNDNFDLDNAHVLPALIRKFHEAKMEGKKEVVIWGTGTPKREFLYVDDMADACVFIMNLEEEITNDMFFSYPAPCFVNVGTGIDFTIMELAQHIQKVLGFEGKIVFDPSKPDGTPRKLLDVSKLRHLGWQSTIGLKTGIEKACAWYLKKKQKK